MSVQASEADFMAAAGAQMRKLNIDGKSEMINKKKQSKREQTNKKSLKAVFKNLGDRFFVFAYPQSAVSSPKSTECVRRSARSTIAGVRDRLLVVRIFTSLGCILMLRVAAGCLIVRVEVGTRKNRLVSWRLFDSKHSQAAKILLFATKKLSFAANQCGSNGTTILLRFFSCLRV